MFYVLGFLKQRLGEWNCCFLFALVAFVFVRLISLCLFSTDSSGSANDAVYYFQIVCFIVILFAGVIFLFEHRVHCLFVLSF